MSRRARVYAIVAGVAVAAAALAVAGALLQGGGEEAPPPPTTEPQPAESRPPGLELDVTVVRTDAEARELRQAEIAYDRGRRDEARRRFERVLRRNPGSVEAAVGAAIAAWPNGTAERLRELVARNPDSGVALLHLGLALHASGDREAAEEQWREAERRDPDSSAALTAEDLLHPGMPPGRPFFLPSKTAPELETLPPARQLRILAERARRGGAADWILYGAALQRAERPVSAREAFDRALALDQGNVEARAAVAVGRFDKDDPSQAFSRLGPLASAHPRSPVVRFHLGLMLLWLRQLEQARNQLELAREAGPGTRHGRAAASLLRRLGPIRP